MYSNCGMTWWRPQVSRPQPLSILGRLRTLLEFVLGPGKVMVMIMCYTWARESHGYDNVLLSKVHISLAQYEMIRSCYPEHAWKTLSYPLHSSFWLHIRLSQVHLSGNARKFRTLPAYADPVPMYRTHFIVTLVVDGISGAAWEEVKNRGDRNPLDSKVKHNMLSMSRKQRRQKLAKDHRQTNSNEYVALTQAG